MAARIVANCSAMFIICILIPIKWKLSDSRFSRFGRGTTGASGGSWRNDAGVAFGTSYRSCILSVDPILSSACDFCRFLAAVECAASAAYSVRYMRHSRNRSDDSSKSPSLQRTSRLRLQPEIRSLKFVQITISTPFQQSLATCPIYAPTSNKKQKIRENLLICRTSTNSETLKQLHAVEMLQIWKFQQCFRLRKLQLNLRKIS